MLTVEQGEPTSLVAALIKELSSRIKLDLGETGLTRDGPLGFTKLITGAELIQKVVQDPQILWKRNFYMELNMLAQDQKQVVYAWFTQMSDVSS